MCYKNLFAQRLVLLRKQNKSPLKTISKSIGISNQAISKFEKQKSLPRFEILCSLADHFNVSLDYLVGRSNDPKKH